MNRTLEGPFLSTISLCIANRDEDPNSFGNDNPHCTLKAMSYFAVKYFKGKVDHLRGFIALVTTSLLKCMRMLDSDSYSSIPATSVGSVFEGCERLIDVLIDWIKDEKKCLAIKTLRHLVVQSRYDNLWKSIDFDAVSHSQEYFYDDLLILDADSEHEVIKLNGQKLLEAVQHSNRIYLANIGLPEIEIDSNDDIVIEYANILLNGSAENSSNRNESKILKLVDKISNILDSPELEIDVINQFTDFVDATTCRRTIRNAIFAGKLVENIRTNQYLKNESHIDVLKSVISLTEFNLESDFHEKSDHGYSTAKWIFDLTRELKMSEGWKIVAKLENMRFLPSIIDDAHYWLNVEAHEDAEKAQISNLIHMIAVHIETNRFFDCFENNPSLLSEEVINQNGSIKQLIIDFMKNRVGGERKRIIEWVKMFDFYRKSPELTTIMFNGSTSIDEQILIVQNVISLINRNPGISEYRQVFVSLCQVSKCDKTKCVFELFGNESINDNLLIMCEMANSEMKTIFSIDLKRFSDMIDDENSNPRHLPNLFRFLYYIMLIRSYLYMEPARLYSPLPFIFDLISGKCEIFTIFRRIMKMNMNFKSRSHIMLIIVLFMKMEKDCILLGSCSESIVEFMRILLKTLMEDFIYAADEVAISAPGNVDKTLREISNLFEGEGFLLENMFSTSKALNETRSFDDISELFSNDHLNMKLEMVRWICAYLTQFPDDLSDGLQLILISLEFNSKYDLGDKFVKLHGNHEKDCKICRIFKTELLRKLVSRDDILERKELYESAALLLKDRDFVKNADQIRPLKMFARRILKADRIGTDHLGLLAGILYSLKSSDAIFEKFLDLSELIEGLTDDFIVVYRSQFLKQSNRERLVAVCKNKFKNYECDPKIIAEIGICGLRIGDTSFIDELVDTALKMDFAGDLRLWECIESLFDISESENMKKIDCNYRILNGIPYVAPKPVSCVDVVKIKEKFKEALISRLSDLKSEDDSDRKSFNSLVFTESIDHPISLKFVRRVFEVIEYEGRVQYIIYADVCDGSCVLCLLKTFNSTKIELMENSTILLPFEINSIRINRYLRNVFAIRSGSQWYCGVFDFENGFESTKLEAMSTLRFEYFSRMLTGDVYNEFDTCNQRINKQRCLHSVTNSFVSGNHDELERVAIHDGSVIIYFLVKRKIRGVRLDHPDYYLDLDKLVYIKNVSDDDPRFKAFIRRCQTTGVVCLSVKYPIIDMYAVQDDFGPAIDPHRIFTIDLSDVFADFDDMFEVRKHHSIPGMFIVHSMSGMDLGYIYNEQDCGVSYDFSIGNSKIISISGGFIKRTVLITATESGFEIKTKNPHLFERRSLEKLCVDKQIEYDLNSNPSLFHYSIVQLSDMFDGPMLQKLISSGGTIEIPGHVSLLDIHIRPTSPEGIRLKSLLLDFSKKVDSIHLWYNNRRIEFSEVEYIDYTFLDNDIIGYLKITVKRQTQFEDSLRICLRGSIIPSICEKRIRGNIAQTPCRTFLFRLRALTMLLENEYIEEDAQTWKSNRSLLNDDFYHAILTGLIDQRKSDILKDLFNYRLDIMRRIMKINVTEMDTKIRIFVWGLIGYAKLIEEKERIQVVKYILDLLMYNTNERVSQVISSTFVEMIGLRVDQSAVRPKNLMEKRELVVPRDEGIQAVVEKCDNFISELTSNGFNQPAVSLNDFKPTSGNLEFFTFNKIKEDDADHLIVIESIHAPFRLTDHFIVNFSSQAIDIIESEIRSDKGKRPVLKSVGLLYACAGVFHSKDPESQKRCIDLFISLSNRTQKPYPLCFLNNLLELAAASTVDHAMNALFNSKCISKIVSQLLLVEIESKDDIMDHSRMLSGDSLPATKIGIIGNLLDLLNKALSVNRENLHSIPYKTCCLLQYLDFDSELHYKIGAIKQIVQFEPEENVSEYFSQIVPLLRMLMRYRVNRQKCLDYIVVNKITINQLKMRWNGSKCSDQLAYAHILKNFEIPEGFKLNEVIFSDVACAIFVSSYVLSEELAGRLVIFLNKVLESDENLEIKMDGIGKTEIEAFIHSNILGWNSSEFRAQASICVHNIVDRHSQHDSIIQSIIEMDFMKNFSKDSENSYIPAHFDEFYRLIARYTKNILYYLSSLNEKVIELQISEEAEFHQLLTFWGISESDRIYSCDEVCTRCNFSEEIGPSRVCRFEQKGDHIAPNEFMFHPKNSNGHFIYQITEMYLDIRPGDWVMKHELLQFNKIDVYAVCSRAKDDYCELIGTFNVFDNIDQDDPVSSSTPKRIYCEQMNLSMPIDKLRLIGREYQYKSFIDCSEGECLYERDEYKPESQFQVVIEGRTVTKALKKTSINDMDLFGASTNIRNYIWNEMIKLNQSEPILNDKIAELRKLYAVNIKKYAEAICLLNMKTKSTDQYNEMDKICGDPVIDSCFRLARARNGSKTCLSCQIDHIIGLMSYFEHVVELDDVILSNIYSALKKCENIGIPRIERKTRMLERSLVLMELEHGGKCEILTKSLDDIENYLRGEHGYMPHTNDLRKSLKMLVELSKLYGCTTRIFPQICRIMQLICRSHKISGSLELFDWIVIEMLHVSFNFLSLLQASGENIEIETPCDRIELKRELSADDWLIYLVFSAEKTARVLAGKIIMKVSKMNQSIDQSVMRKLIAHASLAVQEDSEEFIHCCQELELSSNVSNDALSVDFVSAHVSDWFVSVSKRVPDVSTNLFKFVTRLAITTIRLNQSMDPSAIFSDVCMLFCDTYLDREELVQEKADLQSLLFDGATFVDNQITFFNIANEKITDHLKSREKGYIEKCKTIITQLTHMLWGSSAMSQLSDLTLEVFCDPMQSEFVETNSLNDNYTIRDIAASDQSLYDIRMLDVRNFICRQLGYIALLDTTVGLDLIVKNCLIPQQARVIDVYQYHWLPNNGDRDRLDMMFRVTGVTEAPETEIELTHLVGIEDCPFKTVLIDNTINSGIILDLIEFSNEDDSTDIRQVIFAFLDKVQSQIGKLDKNHRCKVSKTKAREVSERLCNILVKLISNGGEIESQVRFCCKVVVYISYSIDDFSINMNEEDIAKITDCLFNKKIFTDDLSSILPRIYLGNERVIHEAMAEQVKTFDPLDDENCVIRKVAECLNTNNRGIRNFFLKNGVIGKCIETDESIRACLKAIAALIIGNEEAQMLCTSKMSVFLDIRQDFKYDSQDDVRNKALTVIFKSLTESEFESVKLESKAIISAYKKEKTMAKQIRFKNIKKRYADRGKKYLPNIEGGNADERPESVCVACKSKVDDKSGGLFGMLMYFTRVEMCPPDKLFDTTKSQVIHMSSQCSLIHFTCCEAYLGTSTSLESVAHNAALLNAGVQCNAIMPIKSIGDETLNDEYLKRVKQFNDKLYFQLPDDSYSKCNSIIPIYVHSCKSAILYLVYRQWIPNQTVVRPSGETTIAFMFHSLSFAIRNRSIDRPNSITIEQLCTKCSELDFKDLPIDSSEGVHFYSIMCALMLPEWTKPLKNNILKSLLESVRKEPEWMKQVRDCKRVHYYASFIYFLLVCGFRKAIEEIAIADSVEKRLEKFADFVDSNFKNVRQKAEGIFIRYFRPFSNYGTVDTKSLMNVVAQVAGDDEILNNVDLLRDFGEHEAN